MLQTLKYAPPVITVDVEDWSQSTWDRDMPISERSVVNTRVLLQILREYNVRVTMFILGKFAEAFPDVVKEIQADGHEIACHGYGHIEIFNQSREEFAKDIRLSKDILEQITGERIKGYRAPDFSVIRDTLWALEILADADFEYDSSIFPVCGSRYGIPEWPVAPTQVCFSGKKSIIEVPIATFSFLGKNWPVGGGGYHRLLPGFMSRNLTKRVMVHTPFVFYCHPYELDRREFKEIPLKIPLYVQIYQGLGRRWFEQRLKAFLHKFGGQRVKDLLSLKEWSIIEPRFLS